MPRPRKRSEEHHEEGPSAERWLLTYADMITLLMVLFIVLFALGQTDIRKFDAFKDSFHYLTQSQTEMPPGGPGVLSQPSAIAILEQNPFAQLSASSANAASGEHTVGEMASGQQTSGQLAPGRLALGKIEPGQQSHSKPPASQKDNVEHLSLRQAEAEMEAALAKLGLAQDVNFTYNSRGLVVSILTDKVLFPNDSAQLQPQGAEIINAIAPVLALLPNEVDVEGDTDNVPIRGGPYANNWALSAMRAVAVVDDLIYHHGVDPYRLQATGNGDTQPVVPNNTPQHRAENRRVEIVIFSTSVATP